jgi:hypothetical protein
LAIVTIRSHAVCLVAHAFLAVCALGCGRRAGNERFVPSEATSRRAVGAALAAWKAGEPADRTIRLSEPTLNLEVADTARRPGQRLVDYEILGEVSAEGPRCLAVRLKLEEPTEELEVLYYLVGIDPLFVFRQEDYELLTHWEMSMPDEAPADLAEGRQP